MKSVINNLPLGMWYGVTVNGVLVMNRLFCEIEVPLDGFSVRTTEIINKVTRNSSIVYK